MPKTNKQTKNKKKRISKNQEAATITSHLHSKLHRVKLLPCALYYHTW